MRKLFLLLFVSLFANLTFAQVVRSIKATDLEKIIAESKGPLVINMWATWCKPCIEELPHFLEEAKKHEKDSLQMLLVSLDFKESFPKAIEAFAKKRDIKVPMAWLDETNADYFCSKLDPKWSGAIPATLFINNKTGYRNFIEEQISHDQLKEEIKAILEKN